MLTADDNEAKVYHTQIFPRVRTNLVCQYVCQCLCLKTSGIRLSAFSYEGIRLSILPYDDYGYIQLSLRDFAYNMQFAICLELLFLSFILKILYL